MRDSTIFYRSFYDAIRELPMPQQGEVYDAIFSYCFDGQSIDLKGISKTIFTLIKPQLDANIKRYENGKKGGKSKPNDNQNLTKLEPKPNQNETKTQPNKNNNYNVNENNNNNENENVCITQHAPTRDEFLSYCQSLDIDYERFKVTLGAKYDTWVADGWVNGYGKPIRDWKKTIINTLPHLKPMPVKQTPVTTKAKGSFGVKKGGAND